LFNAFPVYLLEVRLRRESFRQALELAGMGRRKEYLFFSLLLRTIGFSIYWRCASKGEIKNTA
jgi:hypothetical protein